MTLTKERVAIYIAALSDLSAAQLDHAFKHALKYFKPEFGVMFPVPAELRLWAQDYKPEPQFVELPRWESAKPPGWRPLTELHQQVAKVADSKAMDRPARRTLHEQQRAMALARLGGSTMPTDPAARKEWQHEKAVENGWIKRREPGEDEE